jgi:beta-adrenergic-receptor kinase
LQIKSYEKLECSEERMKQARDIYDNFIMKELLARSHDYSKECLQHVQKHLMKNDVPVTLFEVSTAIARWPPFMSIFCAATTQS